MRRIVRQCRWPIGIVLGYDQVKRWESDPEVLRLAMQMADADTSPGEAFRLGGRA